MTKKPSNAEARNKFAGALYEFMFFLTGKKNVFFEVEPNELERAFKAWSKGVGLNVDRPDVEWGNGLLKGRGVIGRKKGSPHG